MIRISIYWLYWLLFILCMVQYVLCYRQPHIYPVLYVWDFLRAGLYLLQQGLAHTNSMRRVMSESKTNSRVFNCSTTCSKNKCNPVYSYCNLIFFFSPCYYCLCAFQTHPFFIKLSKKIEIDHNLLITKTSCIQVLYY